MPCERKHIKRGKQPALDDLEVLRLQAMTRIPSEVRLKWETKYWETVPRFQLRRRRSTTHVGSRGLHGNMEDVYDTRDQKLSTASLPQLFQDPALSTGQLGTRATSEPPVMFRNFNAHDPGLISLMRTEESVPRGWSNRPLFSSLSSASGSLNSLGSSMSRRRMASNVPSLASYVSLPSATSVSAGSDLYSSSTYTSSNTLSLCDSLSDLSLKDDPHTPACQLIQPPHSPPEAPRQTNVKSLSRKLPLPSLRPNRASFPFTPLEVGVSPPGCPPESKRGSLLGRETFLPAQRRVQQTVTPPLPQRSFSSLASSCSTNTMHHTQSQTPEQLTSRHVPLILNKGALYGPLNAQPGQPPPQASKSEGLASPLILDSTFKPLVSPRIPQASPLQRTVGSSESPDYFNVFTSKN